MSELPRLTAELPGTGGRLRCRPEDFVVEEIPAYGPCGSGEHVLATIEKRDLTTREAVKRLADALGVAPDAIGSAGLKDRHAITRQQLSLPRPVTPQALRAVQIEGLRVLSADWHKNKLKTGHLRGNRFELIVRDLAVPLDEAFARAQAILAALSRPPGLPNFYGEQRFGAAGDNADRGRALLLEGRCTPPPRDGREKRFLLSSLQSSLFNAYLEQRMKDGLFDRVITGDILAKPSGASFASEDVATEQVRLAAGEIAPTGPMFGHSMREPAAGSEAAAREESILAAAHLKRMDFARHGLLEGTRRALGVALSDPGVEALPADGAIRLRFGLPSGSYATVVAGEILKGGEPFDLPTGPTELS